MDFVLEQKLAGRYIPSRYETTIVIWERILFAFRISVGKRRAESQYERNCYTQSSVVLSKQTRLLREILMHFFFLFSMKAVLRTTDWAVCQRAIGRGALYLISR